MSDLKSTVRSHYAAAARRVTSGEGVPATCCESTGCCGGSATASCDPISSNLYDPTETAFVPAEAVLASLGCGNPTALAELHEGETVLDLGSGGGIDVLLSARRVGLTGKAYGLDMTDEMLELARENARKAGAENVQFLKGEIEQIPLPDNSVDVIISNCVINLSGDKRRVLAEAFRVLKPGGRFAVSDVVVRGEVPDEVRRDAELWAGCVAGALEENEFLTLLAETGFENAGIEPLRFYDESLWRKEDGAVRNEESARNEHGGSVLTPPSSFLLFSGFVRATKPTVEARAKELDILASTGQSCCGPTCCSGATA